MMTNLKIGKLAVLTAGVMALGMTSIASAQTVRHDFMDATAARRDIAKLKVDRAFAARTHDWGKVAQDDRLIAQDRFWIHRDEWKIRRAGG